MVLIAPLLKRLDDAGTLMLNLVHVVAVDPTADAVVQTGDGCSRIRLEEDRYLAEEVALLKIGVVAMVALSLQVVEDSDLEAAFLHEPNIVVLFTLFDQCVFWLAQVRFNKLQKNLYLIRVLREVLAVRYCDLKLTLRYLLAQRR